MIGFVKKAFHTASKKVATYSRRVRGALGDLVYPYVRLTNVEGEFPKRLKPRVLYVLSEGGEPWQAALICPCGCGEILDLNLLPDERPCWRFSVDRKGRASLTPSVWRKIECQSHFWLRGGRITWV